MHPDEKQAAAVARDAEEELWRQRVGALTVVPALLRQLGADPAAVLAAAGVDPAALDFAENTIAYAAFGRLVEEGARQSGCAHFGLLVGQAWHLPTMGLIGQLVRHAPTVGAGLRLAVVHHHLNSHGGVIFLHERGAMAEFGYAIYHRGVRGAGQILDGVLAAQVSYLRELCGPGWVPTEVRVAHAAPADPGPYRRLFRCPVRFDCELSSLRFPAHWLARPIPGADATMLRELEQQAGELTEPELIEKLQRSLRVLLLSGVSSGDAVADMLAMHRRTLNRRLEALGTTLRQVLDDVRFEAACQLLADTHLTLDDIAGALGYSGVSPFTRAFRRRSGSSPGHWRRDAQAGGADRRDPAKRPTSRPTTVGTPAGAPVTTA